MFAATVLLCAVSMRVSDTLTVRDLTPFTGLDEAVTALPVPSVRTYSGLAKLLARHATSPIERARAAYVWTTAHVAYSLDRHRDAASALTDLTGDCDAHAAVFASLCKNLGVECVTIGGGVRFAVPPEGGLSAIAKKIGNGQWLVDHAWNAVRIDGRWGLVDSTMGGASSPKSEVTAPADDYFLPDPNIFATDHVPQEPRWNLTAAPGDLIRQPVVRPLAWRLGIGTEDLITEGKSEASRIVLRPHVAWRKGMRAALQTDQGSLPDRVLVQPCSEGTEIRLAPPGPASIVWLGVTVAGQWRPIAGYPVVGPTADRLPKVMSRFYDSGASLVGPFDYTIAAGQAAEIRLRAPGAEQVVAFQGQDLAGKFTRDGDSWVFRAAPSAGRLEVMASYDDPRKFIALLTYDVR